MPGLVGHDFGAAIRFAANFVEEDSPRADKAGVNLHVYWAFAEGFLKETAATLTEAEVNTLGISCFALACELATRFLDDYILGDKYFKVTLKENNMTNSKKETNAKEKAKIVSVKESAEGKMDVTTSEASSLEVAAEMQCVGHPPKAPVLNYLRKDPAIQSLIALRMDQASPHHLKYTLKLSNSSGIKEKDAVKIDAALKALKIAGSASLVSEARSESRRFFEYEIDF